MVVWGAGKQTELNSMYIYLGQGLLQPIFKLRSNLNFRAEICNTNYLCFT